MRLLLRIGLLGSVFSLFALAASQTSELRVRNAHSAVFDDRQGIVIFGGADETAVRNDLWQWNGQRWQCLASSGPVARTFAALSYDRARRRIVLFGGNRVLFGGENDKDTFLSDTWEWDGQQWREVKTPGPSARAEAAVAYDAERRRTVLFGGYHLVNGKINRLGETWEWDGAQWRQVSVSGPAARNGAAMVYDNARKKIVLSGGSTGAVSGETWEWDGARWQRIESATAPGRFNSAMAYDEARRRVVRFGGWDGQQRTGDTWEYDGREWKLLNASGPVARNHATLTYDRRRKRVVLFGGHDGENVFGDTWEWDGTRWQQRVMTSPLSRIDNGH